MHGVFYRYLEHDCEKFYTICLLPKENGKFPTIISRSPYVKSTVSLSEEQVAEDYYRGAKRWLDNGYAVVFQHCRGQGKSTGAFVPYVHEREDGLALRQWIREQDFYNGELYLLGGSYSSSLHYATAPFEADVKGAILEIQDSERYRLWYRNGQMRKGHANWHFGLYKDKCGLKKDFSMSSFSSLPLKGLSERVLGDHAEDFEQMLEAYSPSHPFWSTRNGGADARDAVTNAGIPILLTTGYNDFYVGGVFDMWRRMDENTRSMSALLVSPYDHGDGYHRELGVAFPNGQRRQGFGDDYQIKWLEHIRLGTPLPFKKGVITYYRAFEDRWESDFYGTEVKELTVPLGEGERSFTYDPLKPTPFRCEGFTAEETEGREDVISLLTPEFEADTFVKGRIKAVLTVSSSAPDTSFYVRISIKKAEYTYVLRHDITSLCYQHGDYTENSVAELSFSFDEHAFLIKKGERLRIDVASTDDNTYVCHTNKKGEYYLQDQTDVAENKLYLDGSCIILPVE